MGEGILDDKFTLIAHLGEGATAKVKLGIDQQTG